MKRQAARWRWIAAALLASPGGFLAPALADEPELNTRCPVMTEEAADPEITVEYRGKKVALCCDKCVRKFQAQPEKYLANLPQFAGFVGGFASEEESKPQGATVSAARPEEKPFWGRLHPAIVHLPVAGLPLAFLAFLIASVSGKERFAGADLVILVPSALAAVAAYFTGNVAEEAERFSASMHELAERHEKISTVVMILSLVLSALRLWRWKGLSGGWRWLYGAGLLAASGLVGFTGYLGGSLVFGPDHLKW